MAISAGLVLFAHNVVPAQNIADAEAFVRITYNRYSAKSPNSPDFLGRDAPSVFTPSLLRLIRSDERHTPRGDVGKLDGDPICDCQDPDSLKLISVLVTPQTRTSANADITLQYPSEPSPRHMRLQLILLTKGWRIDDISAKDMPSLRRLLQ
ncbi:MAG: hypothetical protein ABR910_13695 [Acidobacteriaceae bacterium]|jgi:hypothetical protein